ncbi:MAG: tRNA (adenosine(37)-N6)-threonylcarbamoyltransferase complex dimerization subunit type 1 TsaB [Spirochaetales bacterium]|nr:tRNA (adenosine(37)-N6)-threonylcarbamoyltransferase complex dimerization subunit type 1 TsaB [Spirochaetales bacterium]
MTTVLIDSSTEILLVALHSAKHSTFRQTKTGLNHAQKILEDLQALLEETGITPEQLSGIGCSLGPGSFTGLRIGLCTAKGLAEGWKIPLFGLDSFRAMVEAAVLAQPSNEYFLPIIDARKGRFYGQLFQKALPMTEPVDFTPEEFLRWQHESVVLCGYQPHLLKTRLDELQKWPPGWRVCEGWNDQQGATWAKPLTQQVPSQDVLAQREILGPFAGPRYLRPSEAEESKS